MSRSIKVAIAVFLLAGVVASAGDVRFIYVRSYLQQEERQLSEEQQLDAILQPLEGAGGAEVLRSNGCQELAEFYNMLHESFQRDILDAMAAMHEGDLYIYMVDDRNGVTEEVRDLIGASIYERPQTMRPESVWLCGSPSPERAVWIGERFAGDYYQAFTGLPGTVVVSGCACGSTPPWGSTRPR